MALTSELSNDVVHVLELAHGTRVGAQLLLSQLLGTLLLRVADKLNETALVGGETSHLVNKGTDESGALGDNALASSKLGLDGLRGDLVALVLTNSNSSLGGNGHFYFCLVDL